MRELWDSGQGVVKGQLTRQPPIFHSPPLCTVVVLFLSITTTKMHNVRVASYVLFGGYFFSHFTQERSGIVYPQHEMMDEANI